MIVFEYEGKKYVTINGKSFYLFRGYERDRGDVIFAQVAGNFPLYPEDLPDKKWGLIKTKAKDATVYIAYNQEYHCYQSDRAKGKLLFPAPTARGSFFLLLKHVNDRCGLKMEERELCRVPEEAHHGLIEKVKDKGNSGTDVYMLDFFEGFEERLKSIILNE